MDAIPKSTARKMLEFPLVRIVVGIAIVIVLVNISQKAAKKLLGLTSLNADMQKLVVVIIMATVILTGYSLLYKYYERRKITELSVHGMGKYLLTGFLIGAALQSLTILVIYISGGYIITAVNSILFIIPALSVSLIAAVFEEVVMRGIIFRITEEKLGSYIALVISAIIFGGLHLANPHSSLTAALQIAIEAGILLAVAYMYTRSLWFTIAIHFAWNFMQTGIFGATTSGMITDKSLITAKIQGADWLTGGAFGPEGSIQATIFCLIAGIIFLVLCQRHNKIIKPYWKK